MARAPDPRIEQAKAMYLSGKKLVEIASQLNLPEGTVRRWKSTHDWDNERSDKNSERSERKKEKKKKQVAVEVEQILENSELTDKQRLFCMFYIKSFNATKAYQKAYGCSYETAAAIGYRLLENVGVKEEIQRLKRSRMNRELLDEHDIFQKYMDIAFADITDFLEFGQEEVQVMSMYGPVEVKDPETGEKKPLMKKVNTVRFKPSAEVDGTLISEVKPGRDGASIKLLDRMKALEWLADHMDLATAEQQEKIELIKARTIAVTGEKENDEAIQKLDSILKGMRENAAKQETE